MIPQSAITEWSSQVPWQSNEQIEQDLVICRALVEIFNDDFLAHSLAFRGGTAIHKLFLLPQARYSEDIDLVQIRPEGIKQTVMQLQKRLSFLGESSVERKTGNTTLKFRFVSEIPPIQPLRLKIEINCREHFEVLGWQHAAFMVDSVWFKGRCELTTYRLEELLGTKLRALYQRRKGRDLYDLYKAMTHAKVDTNELLKCYNKYMAFSVAKPPTKKQFLINLEDKIIDSDFLGDIKALIRPNEEYNVDEAYELVRTILIENIT